jgi:hypothetical protein
MKKIIINVMGILSVVTMLIMVVVKVGWTDKVDNQVSDSSDSDKVNEIKGSENSLASMCERIGHLSENLSDNRPQNAYISCEPDNSSKNNRRQFDESLLEDSFSDDDPTDYPSKDLLDSKDDGNNGLIIIERVGEYKKAKPPDIIE